jgi:hypothetical protein
MPTFAKYIISGSTHGAMIAVTGSTTGATGTLIHTAVTGTATTGNEQDEVYIHVMNTATADKKIVIGWGGTTTDHLITQSIPSLDGLYQVVAGMPIRNGLLITAQATENTQKLKVIGYVNRVVT